MTIERTVSLKCDGTRCRNEVGPYSDEDFDALLAEAREYGWKLTIIDEEWVHYCSDCKEDFE